MKQRKLTVAVISDIHLATHACKAKKVVKYLKSIEPRILVLNGDIIDSWRFTRSYFPKSHLKVIRQIIKMMEKDIQVHYITGNHDEFLRKFNDVEIGKLKISNQLTLNIDNKNTWIFYGDIFDHTIHKAKWLAKFGAATKGLLTLVNKFVNLTLKIFNRNEVLIYKSMKSKLLKDNLSLFEKTIGIKAISKNSDTVICGHTHVPKDCIVKTDHGDVRYLNCGDWVENFTATEYYDGDWSLFHYDETIEGGLYDESDIPNKREVYNSLYKELVIASLQHAEPLVHKENDCS